MGTLPFTNFCKHLCSMCYSGKDYIDSQLLLRVVLFLAKTVKNSVFIFIKCLSDKHMRKHPKRHLTLCLSIHRWKEEIKADNILHIRKQGNHK
jgi:hypothetical protein